MTRGNQSEKVGLEVTDETGELVYANGIDATTGGYLLPPLRPAEIADLARRQEPDRDLLAALRKATGVSGDHLGLPFDVDPANLAQAGWGVVFSADEDEQVQDALAPLLALRMSQMTDAARLKQLDYVTGESRRGWLARHGVTAGNVDPPCVPYYLLVVGCPEKIPFGFCRELSVEYAVGLLSFDTPAEYAAYVASVVAAESNELKPRSRRVTFFCPRHPFDPATELSADQLVKPLADGNLASRVGCNFESISGDAATHEALAGVLARRNATAPGLLFTASHGMGFPAGHADQRARQGALVCQDWAGPRAGAIARDQYFAGADVPDDADVSGLFAFFFACFSAGTPSRDRFAHTPGAEPPELADAAFAAALPQRLLAHPGGSALGCIGHVERAWGDSIIEAGAGPQLIPFENAIGNVLAGKPIGLALKDFNERFAALSVSLAGLLEQIGDGLIVPDRQLAKAWIQRNDAEGYALFGDPATRLRLEQAA
jgi:hypothetical protein